MLENFRSIIANTQVEQLQCLDKNSTPSAKKHGVSKRTADKWLAEYDKTLNMSVWLKYKLADRDHVVALKCVVCSQFKAKLESTRNYRSAFIEGTNNIRTSTFKEHITTDMHAHAMALFKKQRSSSMFEYAPIARALTNVWMVERSNEAQVRDCLHSS